VVLAHQEPKSRYRLDVCETKAQKTGDTYTVTGLKNLVPAGDKAQAWLVPAQLEGKIALFLVENGASGSGSRGYSTWDDARAADIKLSNTPATLITLDGLAALTWAVDVGIAALCAEAVGAMDKFLAMTIEYMHQRKQFKLPLAAFQVLQHRVADMKMELELARSMSYYATLKLNEPEAERRRAISRAKVQLGRSMRFVGQNGVQLHGGIGVTDEYAGSHYFRRLTQMETTWGDTLTHLGEVSSRMQDSAGVFA
jgi:alkylation response protein AidB-like acyl-CoA dehydrogenase